MAEEDALKYYFVSMNGRVMNRKTGHVLQPQKNTKGYLRVNLGVGGRRVFVRIHRLVATMYIPNPHGYPEVNHKDGIKSNNAAYNLEWCTSSENQIHAYQNGRKKLQGSDTPRAKLTEDDVIKIRASLKAGCSQRKAYEDYKDVIGWWSFRDVCRRKSWTQIT